MARALHAEPIYKIANQFRDRCLASNRSLLWPNKEAWTLENLDQFWTAFIDNPDEGSSSFFDKWEIQLSKQTVGVHRVAVDLMAFYYLFPTNIGGDVKSQGVRKVAGWKLSHEVDESIINELDRVLHVNGLGHSGIYYLTGRPWQIAYFLRFARDLKRLNIDPYDLTTCIELANTIEGSVSGSQGARNTLLHLLFPDEFEAIASNDHKNRIAKAFPSLVANASDRDDALLRIRQHLPPDIGRDDFSFYDADVRPLWDTDGSTVTEGPNNHTDRSKQVILEERTEELSLDRLVEVIHLDHDDILGIETLLLEKRQMIFEGPPGSGKTYVAERFARWFAGASLGGLPTDQVEIIQFHQSYGYEDFVQGIRPETDERGSLTYRVRDGLFKRLCETAASHPDRRFVLIIDEINRGNISRIFGELLLLLEYRDQRVRLPYAAQDAEDDGYLSIPSNLYLIGTMNSTDRSLAQVDYALRRRFYFWKFMPMVGNRAPVLERWLTARGLPESDRARVLQTFLTLNRTVSEQLSPEFQIGHSYFMVDDIAESAGMHRVMRHAIRPLLDEYLYGHRDREDILARISKDSDPTMPSDEPQTNTAE